MSYETVQRVLSEIELRRVSEGCYPDTHEVDLDTFNRVFASLPWFQRTTYETDPYPSVRLLAGKVLLRVKAEE